MSGESKCPKCGEVIPEPPAKTRPTIAELEEILKRDDEQEIEILPNGEVRAKGGGTTDIKPLTFRDNLGGEYGRAA